MIPVFSPLFLFPRLAILYTVRLARGLRWRTLLGVCLLAAYWYGEASAIGITGQLWFPGQDRGFILFTVFFAVAGIVFGTDAIAQWHRSGGERLFYPRLVKPGLFAAASAGAALLAATPLIALLVLWPVVGAWRADYPVLWCPSLAYIFLAGMPGFLVGYCGAFLARTFLASDLGSMFVALLLSAPAIAWRLEGAPIKEAFTLASAELGILVPLRTLLLEGAAVYCYAVVLLAVAVLTLPSSLPNTGKRREGFWRLGVPGVEFVVRRTAIQFRQWSWGSLAAALVAAATLVLAFSQMGPSLGQRLTLAKQSAPPATNGGVVPRLDIARRDAAFEPDAAKPLTVTLTATPEAETRVTMLDIGKVLRIESATLNGKPATVLPGVYTDARLTVIRFDEPWSDEGELMLSIRPTPAGERLWERAWHPRFHRFAVLGPWWVESARVDFNTATTTITKQPSPFSIIVPERSGLAWAAGSATTREQGDRVVVSVDYSEVPDNLVAANYYSFEEQIEEGFVLRFLVLPERRELAENLVEIYGESFRRLSRLLGTDPRPYTLYEVPESDPTNPLAMTSGELDLMTAALPGLKNPTQYTRSSYDAVFPDWNRGIVAESIDRTFSSFEDEALLDRALATYIHLYATAEGKRSALLGLSRRDVALVPWDVYSQRTDKNAFRIVKENEWQGALGGEGLVADKRRVAFHHMLRGIVGDSAFRDGLLALFDEKKGERFTIADYRNYMEQASGLDLSEYFRQWLVEGVVPKFRILQAQAFLGENPETRVLEYRTEVTIVNRGTGSVEVPWRLVTEGDPLSNKRLLGPSEEAKLVLVTPDRPVGFEIDPFAWVVFAPPTSKENATTTVYFNVITEI